MTSEYAPGPLRLVQEFINTLNEDVDEIAEPDGLQLWLVEHDLIGPDDRVTLADHRRAVAVREGLRALLEAHHGGEVGRADLDRLNEMAASALLRATFREDGSVALVAAASGIDGALGEIFAAAMEAAVAGMWSRLKVCQMDTCRWAFYDASKNRSGAWCSMRVCGNRAKVRAYQQRRKVKRADQP